MVRYGGGFRYGAAYFIIAEYATLRNKKIPQNIIQNYTKCRKIFQDDQIFLTILVEFDVRITYMVAVYERNLVYSPSIILS